MKKRPKIVVVRGVDLNRFEMQAYERIDSKSFEISAIGSRLGSHQETGLQLPVVRLNTPRSLMRSRLLRAVGARISSRGAMDHLIGLSHHVRGAAVVHAAETFIPMSEQCARLKRRYGFKLVLTCWENIAFAYDDDPVTARRKVRVKQATDHFIAVTPEARDALLVEGIADNRITVIPAGVDRERFASAQPMESLRRRLNLPPEAPLFVYIGRLIREKGLVALVEAFAWARSSCSPGTFDAHLLLVGEGPERRRIEFAARTLGIGHLVHFGGFVGYDDIPAIHALASVFVLPSLSTPYWQEQFGMVLIEALSAGTPILSTDSGSIASVVGDAAILVQPYDKAAMTNAILDLATNKERRIQLSERAVLHSQQYSSDVIGDQLSKLYREILET